MLTVQTPRSDPGGLLWSRQGEEGRAGSLGRGNTTISEEALPVSETLLFSAEAEAALPDCSTGVARPADPGGARLRASSKRLLAVRTVLCRYLASSQLPGCQGLDPLVRRSFSVLFSATRPPESQRVCSCASSTPPPPPPHLHPRPTCSAPLGTECLL